MCFSQKVRPRNPPFGGETNTGDLVNINKPKPKKGIAGNPMPYTYHWGMVFTTRRASTTPATFWLSWADLHMLHGIYSTFMLFHILRPLRTTFVLKDGRMSMKFDMRGYSFLLSDFPVQTSMSKLQKLLEKKQSVASRTCWKSLAKIGS